jgi:hypothetical protein
VLTRFHYATGEDGDSTSSTDLIIQWDIKSIPWLENEEVSERATVKSSQSDCDEMGWCVRVQGGLGRP